jgi:hypothetical protein
MTVVLSNSPQMFTAFVPTQLPSLALWLKADATNYQDTGTATPAVLDGAVVGNFADQSGSANNATQATGANKGVLKLSQQNGKPAVLLNGTSNFYTLATTLSQTAYSVYAVMKPATGNDGGILGGAGSAPQFRYTGGASPKLSGYDGAQVFSSALARGDNLMSLYEGVLSAGTFSFFQNGSAYGTGAVAPSGYSVFGALVNGSANWLSAYVCELLFYGAAHNATQRGQVETYLNSAARWALY